MRHLSQVQRNQFLTASFLNRYRRYEIFVNKTAESETKVFLKKKDFSLARKHFPLARGNFPLTRKHFKLVRGNLSLTRKHFSLVRGNLFLTRKHFPVAREKFSLARKHFRLTRENLFSDEKPLSAQEARLLPAG